jgi:hypothetical protein
MIDDVASVVDDDENTTWCDAASLSTINTTPAILIECDHRGKLSLAWSPGDASGRQQRM